MPSWTDAATTGICSSGEGEQSFVIRPTGATLFIKLMLEI